MLFFFFNDTATTEIYTLSLHDALPIFFRYGKVGKGVAIQCLNREPLETPVFKSGTFRRGGCKQFPNRELLEPSVSKLGNVGKGD